MKGDFLSGQELHLMELIAKGHTHKAAAEKMYMSPRTIDGYRDKIFEKLGCKSTAHAIAILFRQGILK